MNDFNKLSDLAKEKGLTIEEINEVFEAARNLIELKYILKKSKGKFDLKPDVYTRIGGL